MTATAPLTICHLLQIYELGGAEQVAFDLARAQKRAGHRVLVAATEGTGPRGAHFEAEGIPAAVIKKGRGLDPTLIARLALHFRRHRVSIVHTHTQQPLIFGAPAARLAGAEVVHTMHGAEPGADRRRLLRSAAARLLKAFVVVSSSLQREVERGREAPAGRLRLIENGIDLARFEGARAHRDAVRDELGIPPGAWVIAHVARLVPVKNQALLLRAAAPLLDAGARLLLCGEGPEEGALRALAGQLGVASRVLFLGGRTDVPRVLAAADVFALSSDAEGLPLAPIEAMAMGLPVVATGVGGVPDLVVDGVSGWITPAGDVSALRDRLTDLRADPARAASMGEAGRAHALARRSLDRMTEAYLALYTSPAPRGAAR
ncbi:MAG: glycosyltransferase [Byssovorax sp.]